MSRNDFILLIGWLMFIVGIAIMPSTVGTSIAFGGGIAMVFAGGSKICKKSEE